MAAYLTRGYAAFFVYLIQLHLVAGGCTLGQPFSPEYVVEQPVYSQTHGPLPFLSFDGTVSSCGEELGWTWREALQHNSMTSPKGRAWWQQPSMQSYIDEWCPHLPELFSAMAKGAELSPEQVGHRMILPEDAGCTSFAIAPDATRDGIPISGQTKDTSIDRAFRYQVLRMNFADAPSMLTLTYPGWLFGHGFIEGRCAIFRNSLYTDPVDGWIPYEVWGILSLHAPSVDDVIEFARRHEISNCWHTTVADAQGNIAGIEYTDAGVGVLRSPSGIYTHANAVVASADLAKTEKPKFFERNNSNFRATRLRELLEVDASRLTAQLAWHAMCDHKEFPISICRHQCAEATTTAAVVVEPTRGLLHASRGNPCISWPATYAL